MANVRNDIMRRRSGDWYADENEDSQRAKQGQTRRDIASEFDTATPRDETDGGTTPKYKNGGFVAAHASGKRDYPKGKR